MPANKEASIIEVIQNMVREGETEEKIIQNLKELGVEPEKAKRLLLLGQADTFALLRSEISNIAKSDVESNVVKLQETVNKKMIEARTELKKSIETDFKKDFEVLKNSLIAENKDFREGIAEDVQKTLSITEKFRENLNELNLKVGEINADLEEVRLGGVGIRNKIMSMALIVGGIFFLIASVYLFFFKFSNSMSIDAMIFTIITAMIGITMLFVATIV